MEKQSAPACVLIADRAFEVRQALRLVCEESPGLVVAGEASDSRELLASVRTVRPDMLFLEWDLPGLPTAALI